MRERKSNPKIPFNREELAWCAGFLDGEGWFSSIKNKRGNIGCEIGASQVRIEPLNRLVTILGGKIDGPIVTTHQDKYSWKISSFEQVQSIVSLLWKWLSEPKREDASRMLLEMRKYNEIQKSKHTSMFRGVSFNTRLNKWTATIEQDGIKYWIGCFDDELEASFAYKEKHNELYGLKETDE